MVYRLIININIININTHVPHFHVHSGPWCLVCLTRSRVSGVTMTPNTSRTIFSTRSTQCTRGVLNPHLQSQVFSLSSHRQSYVGLIFNSRFIERELKTVLRQPPSQRTLVSPTGLIEISLFLSAHDACSFCNLHSHCAS